MLTSILLSGLLCLSIGSVEAVVFSAPFLLPINGSPKLEVAPIGVSIEFFAFPAYMKFASTNQCLKNFQELTGVWPPLRIGGTTQDRASYDSLLPEAVRYNAAGPGSAPMSLKYGPPFIDLASTYGGSVILGLNRRLNDQPNTIAAAQRAVTNMKNLIAIELGNEPNFFRSHDPINTNGGTWTAADDIASQVSWQQAVGTALKRNNIFSAGIYLATNDFSIHNLVPAETSKGALKYVKYFSSHKYPQSRASANLHQLMNHSAIARQISPYFREISSAKAAGKPFIMGETNSATQGGGGISPMFGAALWVLDYSFQLLHAGTTSIYFHQGTIGNCPYCWWNAAQNIGSPYYGAYFATLALAKASYIAPLDDFSSTLGAWGIYGADMKLIKILLINSNFYESSSNKPRPRETFVLQGLSGKQNMEVSAVRLSAPSATSRQNLGQKPTVGGGQIFADATCEIQGKRTLERAKVDETGKASFVLAATEALLVYLD